MKLILSLNSFCAPAVSVQITSHAAGIARHPDVALALDLHGHHGRQQQGNRGQHLIGDAEQRPQRVDAAERIDRALVQEVAPGADADRPWR